MEVFIPCTASISMVWCDGIPHWIILEKVVLLQVSRRTQLESNALMDHNPIIRSVCTGLRFPHCYSIFVTLFISTACVVNDGS